VAHWTEDVSQLVDPIRRLTLRSGVGPIRSVLAEAIPILTANNYDNWNGGTTHYTLTLRLPDRVYVEAEDNIEDFEKQILARVERMLRGETHDFVNEVLIQPMLDEQGHVPSESKFWSPGHFRLFVSHLSENRANAGRLKSTLEPLGVTAFVAHEDIEPTREWQREIESALFSMDGLVAILARGFGQSNWTDHEVGVALGREVIVIPVMYGHNPYGLMGKFQGIKGEGRMLSEVTEDIFSTLMKNKLSSGKLVTSLVELFLVTGTPSEASAKLGLLSQAELVPTDHLNKVRERVQNNADFLADDSLVDLTNTFLKKHGSATVDRHLTRSHDDVEDDAPF